MFNFEFGKIFAAILVAVVTAILSGFIAEKLSYAEDLEKDAVPIEAAAVTGNIEKDEAPIENTVIAVDNAVVAKNTDGPGSVLNLIASADIARGEKLSRLCSACHSFDQGGSNKVGPNLWNIVGAPKAGKEGFRYSTAMKEYGGVWSYEDLNGFLWKPKKFIAGTKMSYAGVKKLEDRAAMIAWLRIMADSAQALPSEEEIAAADEGAVD